MKLTIPPNLDGLPYFEADFVGGERTLRWISKEEKDRLVPDERDAHFDMTTGVWSILTETGDRRRSPRPFPFGPARWEFAVKVLIAAADYVYPPSTMDIYTTFYRIQKAFGKPPEQRQKRKIQKAHNRNKGKRPGTTTKSTFWFKVERNPTYRIRLSPARSYRIITNANLDGLKYAIDRE